MKISDITPIEHNVIDEALKELILLYNDRKQKLRALWFNGKDETIEFLDERIIECANTLLSFDMAYRQSRKEPPIIELDAKKNKKRSVKLRPTS